MDGNQKKIRNLLLYIGIPVVVLFIIIFLFNNRTPQTVAYEPTLSIPKCLTVKKLRLMISQAEFLINPLSRIVSQKSGMPLRAVLYSI